MQNSKNFGTFFKSRCLYLGLLVEQIFVKKSITFSLQRYMPMQKRRQYFARAVSRWYIYLSKALNLFTKFSVNFLLCDTSIRHLRCPLSMKNFFDALIQISAKGDGNIQNLFKIKTGSSRDNICCNIVSYVFP